MASTANMNNPREIAQLGVKIYNERYKAEYEVKYPGQFLAIDVTGGAATLGSTSTEALKKAKNLYPRAMFHLIRIGHTGAFEVGMSHKNARTDRLYDNDGHPRLTIRISGTHATACAIVDALIDTGFTGFLMLPIAQALPLGLPLYGTGDYTLADGSTVTNFIAEGTVTILTPSKPIADLPAHTESDPDASPPLSELKPEVVKGAIVLGGDGALLGMEFIRSLDKVLLVGKVVMLVDSSILEMFPV